MVRWFFVFIALSLLVALGAFHDCSTMQRCVAQTAFGILLVVFILFLVFGSRDRPG